jgi:hypothetical protein
LKTYTETRFNFSEDNGSHDESSWSLKFAWIQLGGLRIGKDESVFTTFTGYAGNVMADDVVGYGSFDTNLISYYFDAGNGFSAVVSLEEGAGSDSIDSYVPHVVVGAKYTQGWGAITAVGGYDSNWEEWAGKIRLAVNASEQLSLFVMAGYGTDDNRATNFFKTWGENWAVWGGASYQFNEKAAFNFQASYDEAETLSVVANVAYTVVPGLVITPEVNYIDTPSRDGVGGWLRFQRSF